MTQESLTFASSPFWPIAIGFFGLGTGYFIWGGQALFGYPQNSPEVDRTMGLWGFWMPGFCQFLTGVYLMVGLTWFNVFGNAAPLYMAGVAFTVYGIHWFAMAYRRYVGSSATPDGWMAIAYLFISVLGAFGVWPRRRHPRHDYFHRLDLDLLSSKFQRAWPGWTTGGRLVALFQCLTGIWLMYCTWAVTVNTALGYKFWI